MQTSSTLYRYIARLFLVHFLFLLLILLGIVYLLDMIELLRRASSHSEVGFGLVARMGLLKLPEVGQIMLPFAILFSGMFTFWRLNRTHELVVMRAAGVSAWQFLTPLLVVSMGIGLLATTVINPVSSLLLSKFEKMEIQHFDKASNLVTISRTGLWLRQHYNGDGYALIHADSFNQKSWLLSDVIVFLFDDQDNLTGRIDSPSAQLTNGYWEIERAIINNREPPTEFQDIYKIPTNLTASDIEESFASPETLSFWRIPEYIKIMEETGFPAFRLEVYYQSLLARPFFFAAMVLLAAAVSLRPPRLGGTGALIILGVSAGFFIFFLESVLHAFGISQKIPVALAAWTPATVSLLLGVAVILHLEDG